MPDDSPKISHGHEGLLFVHSRAEDAAFCPNFSLKAIHRNFWRWFLEQLWIYYYTMVAHGKVCSIPSPSISYHINFNLHASIPTQTFPRQMRRCLHQTLSVKTASCCYSDTEGDKNVQERGFTFLWIIETLTTNALKLIRLKGWIPATILRSAWQLTTSTRGKTWMGLFIALQVPRL